MVRSIAEDTDPGSPVPPLPVIAAGRAVESFSAALDDLLRAFQRVEEIGMACARALDQSEQHHVT